MTAAVIQYFIYMIDQILTPSDYRVARLLSWCTIGVALFMLTSGLFGRLSGKQDPKPYLVLSSRPIELDQGLVAFASNHPQITYARQDSPIGRSFLEHSFKQTAAPDLVLIGGDKSQEVIIDRTQVQARLDGVVRNSQQNDRQPFFLAAAVGLLAGMFASRHLLRRMTLLLTIGGFAALWKTTHRCPTCEIAYFFGLVEIALAGSVLYFLLAAAVAIKPNLRALGIAIPSTIALWQAGQLLFESVSCPPCTVIFGINLALSASALMEQTPIQIPFRRYTKSQALVWGCCTLTIASLVTLHGAPSLATPKRGAPIEEIVSSWKGRNLSELANIKMPTQPSLVLFGVATCDPCVEAKRTLGLRVDLQLRIVELLRPNQTSSWGAETLPLDETKFPTSPMFCTVAADGTILGVYRGWSNDPLWLQAFLSQVARDLMNEPSRTTQ